MAAPVAGSGGGKNNERATCCRSRVINCAELMKWNQLDLSGRPRAATRCGGVPRNGRPGNKWLRLLARLAELVRGPVGSSPSGSGPDADPLPAGAIRVASRRGLKNESREPA